jgi:hypothetical protein
MAPMTFHRQVIDGQECLIWTCRKLTFGFSQILARKLRKKG